MKLFKLKYLFAIILPAVIFSQSAFTLYAQADTASPEAIEKIRAEGINNSQIMKTLHYLTDIYGPRLTGSPNHKAAADWTVKQMKDWKFDSAALEPWNFGYPGWINERASGFITSPVKDSLVFEVLSWTPGTNGNVSGQAVSLIIPGQPTQEELNAYFESIRSKIKGNMILVGKPVKVVPNLEPPDKRLDENAVKRRLGLSAAAVPAPPPARQRTPEAKDPVKLDALSPQEIAVQMDRFLLENGAAVRINDAGRDHGQIRAFNNRTFDVAKAVPTVVLRNEDYGRIFRILQDGLPVSLEFNIQNKTIPEGTTSYNVIGEIAGTDKKDEVIMLGGHLDSWHAATGATDNAIGCAVMMEAARILKATGLKPRRTIRVALWSGEEQGLLGSQAYVEKHFGSFENPTAAYNKFGGYFNIDSGTGRARGLNVFGPPEAASVLTQIVSPFAEYGIVGVNNSRSRGLGGSDHTSFNKAGLPGIGVLQDPIEYGTYTWHTNLDTYERIVEDDVKKSAVIIATAVYQLAVRDALLPRYGKDEMPAPPPTER